MSAKEYLIHSGISALAAAVIFTGAEIYEPKPDGIYISFERENQEPFIFDYEVFFLDVAGTAFAVQALNHANMLRKKNKIKIT